MLYKKSLVEFRLKPVSNTTVRDLLMWSALVILFWRDRVGVVLTRGGAVREDEDADLQRLSRPLDLEGVQ